MPATVRDLIPRNLLRGLDFAGHVALRNARHAVADIEFELAERRSLTPTDSADDVTAPTAERHLLVLSRPECKRLLLSARVGRLAFIARAGMPLIVPVNYVFDGKSILIRSGPGPKLQAAEREDMVSFEVDDLDEKTRTGWSVVVTGRAKRLRWAHEGSRAQIPPDTPTPQAWPSGPREHLMSIAATRISGRRLGPAGG